MKFLSKRTICVFLVGNVVLFTYMYSYFQNITSKSRETYDRTRIEDYQWAQRNYFKIYKKYGMKDDLGIGFGLNRGDIHERVYEKINHNQIEKFDIHLNLPIAVTDNTYRVIIEIKDCHINKIRYWLVEKDKSPLRLKEIQYKCRK